MTAITFKDKYIASYNRGAEEIRNTTSNVLQYAEGMLSLDFITLFIFWPAFFGVIFLYIFAVIFYVFGNVILPLLALFGARFLKND